MRPRPVFGFARRALRSRTRVALPLLITLLAAAAALPAACGKRSSPAVARRITSRADLIGGPGALGEVGDFLLANDQVRVIVQADGYSRGFGLYGGGLIDADLQRPDAVGNSGGGNGYDTFSELFPAFLLRAMRPKADGIKVVEPEADGDGSAAIAVTGDPADFLFMLKNLNDVVGLGTGLLFKTEYRLRPGKRYVEITTTMINQSNDTILLPGDGVDSFAGSTFTLPMGDIILFGAANHIFAEGAGFDLRFTLEDLYKTPPPLPALPGLVAPFIATKSHGVSYGFLNGSIDDESSYITKLKYPGGRSTDLLVPFSYSGFTAALYAAAPPSLSPRGQEGSQFSFKKYFIIGRGDVASIRDTVHEIRETATGSFSGLVRDEQQAPDPSASVVTFDSRGRPYNQHTPDRGGRFMGTYEPGSYTYRVVSEGRFTTQPVAFEIAEGKTSSVEIDLPARGFVSVRVKDQDGRPLPAKCSLVGRASAGTAGFDPKRFLYDLKMGERRRPTDLIPDGADGSTREYIEQVIYAPSGEENEAVRPGTYRAVCSRGIEYDLSEQQIEVRAGELVSVDAQLHHVVMTPGWVSGDYHLHSANSVDSGMSLERRVAQAAAEGLDIALGSDHNFVTDLGPAIAKTSLEGWLQGMVGLELTTLEIGHFNGFPLTYNPGPITKGSFEWAGREPRALFDELRSLGSLGPERTIVQVNHARDSLLGYFTDYNWNPDTGEPEDEPGFLLAPEGPEFGPDKFDLSFDALEVFNGKRFELIRTYRVPDTLPPPPIPENIPPAGEILRDESGRVAFPGQMEDWFVLLNKGMRKTATGNSDSHDEEEEAGYPRTYTVVSSSDRPGEIAETEIVDALKNQRALVTNGPILRVTANGAGLGETADGTSGQVAVVIDTESAPWLSIDTINVIVNGETVFTRSAGPDDALAHVETNVSIARDSWIVVEASGRESMWPVVTPLEVPSIQISDAVGTLATAFNVDFNPFGNLQPARKFVNHPYAFTNPIFVDKDGDGSYGSPPGVSRQGLEATRESGPRTKAKLPARHLLPMVMRIFAEFGEH